jgi:hypothetical protein
MFWCAANVGGKVSLTVLKVSWFWKKVGRGLITLID